MPGGVPPEVVRDRERKAWDLRQRFWTEARIAQELGISQPAVSKILRRVETRLADRFAKRASRIKARQTAQLEVIATEAFDAWLHSKTPQLTERTTKKAGGPPRSEAQADPGGGQDEGEPAGVEAVDLTFEVVTLNESRTHHCDSSLLNQARAALADIRSIWGLDSPKKSEVAGPEGRPLISVVEVCHPHVEPDRNAPGAVRPPG